jgi:c-di-GMP-binding flagellar brake protein YcgR
MHMAVGERRQHHRYAESACALFVQAEGSGETYSGHVRDLSQGGARLSTSRSFPVGTDLYLGIFLKHMRHGPLVIVARVRRCSPEEGRFALGLEFLESGVAQHDALRRVREHLRAHHERMSKTA